MSENKIKIQGGKKEQLVREWFNAAHNGFVPKSKVLDLYQEFSKVPKDEDISYGLFNGVLKKIQAEGHGASHAPASSDSVVANATAPIEAEIGRAHV